MKKLLMLSVLLAWPAAASAQSESFVVKLGADTIAIETFVRSGNRLEAELSGAAMPSRMRYSFDMTNPAEQVLRFEVIPPGADTASMRGTMTFVRDSVITQMTRGGAAQPEQRGVTLPRATPFINLAFSLVEVITMREKRMPGDSVTAPLFIIGNGVTRPALLKWFARDSAVMSLGGVDLHLMLDARGRIMRAAVPTQNVTVERVAGTLNRAANTKADYSAPAGGAYTAQNVKVSTPAGHALAGTLTLPKARSGRIPAVITISGSGPQDRDETLPGIRGFRPFREVAEYLAGRGVAVLRYDDRGFGESEGVHATATSIDFASDTRAIVDYLRSRPEIDPDRIFLVGHSEGGLIAPMVAAEDAKLRGIVLMAGPAYTGRRILEYQSRHAIDQRTEKTAAQRDSMYRASMATLDALDAAQPWMHFFRDYDPLPVLRKVRVPVLVLQGATDRQVTAEQAGVIANTLRAAGNSDVAVHVLPDVNHLFLQDPVGNAAGYTALPSKSLVPVALQLIGDWIANKSK